MKRFRELVVDGNRFRGTPIVDDDFPALRDSFDGKLQVATELSLSVPRVVTLCGSTRFKDAFIDAARSETLAGRIVISVGCFGHQEAMDMAGDAKKMLDCLHLRKIDISDEVFVLNVGGYVGESTRREIAYAEQIGVPVRYLEAV